jgi:hypothetical protein
MGTSRFHHRLSVRANAPALPTLFAPTPSSRCHQQHLQTACEHLGTLSGSQQTVGKLTRHAWPPPANLNSGHSRQAAMQTASQMLRTHRGAHGCMTTDHFPPQQANGAPALSLFCSLEQVFICTSQRADAPDGPPRRVVSASSTASRLATDFR